MFKFKSFRLSLLVSLSAIVLFPVVSNSKVNFVDNVDSEKENLRVSYHEMGHALAVIFSDVNAFKLEEVTILSDDGNLGVTHFNFGRSLYTYEDLCSYITIFFGGLVAEEMIFGSSSTTVSVDLSLATNIARNMVCSFGMSSLGFAVRSYEKNKDQVDAEVNKILDECYQNCKRILNDNIDALHKTAKELLDKKTMQASEVYGLLGIASR